MFGRILNEIRPHILACQEVDDASIISRFVNDVFTWGSYASAAFTDGPDTDNMLFYDQARLELVGQRRFPTELRDIAEYTLRTKPSAGFQPDTIVVYSMHLKASDGTTNAQQRGREVGVLRSNITNTKYMVACGDMNIYSTSEPAYRAFTIPDSGPAFVDPMGSSWVRNVERHAALYTQATRTATDGACGGGVGGGLDDRFDYIFLTDPLAQRMIAGSYTVFGNDGVPRLNSGVDDPPNQVVSSQIAADLRCASDHLPVFCTVVVGDVPARLRGDAAIPVPSLWPTVADTHVTISGLIPGEPYAVYTTTGDMVFSGVASTTTERHSVAGYASGRYTVTSSTGTWRLAFAVVR
jgi:endonuclease/exonuclease/phosphatase family metal-dependent hydrolase